MDVEELTSELKYLQEDLKNKVDWKLFIFVVGGLASYIVWQIWQIQSAVLMLQIEQAKSSVINVQIFKEVEEISVNFNELIKQVEFKPEK